MRCKCARAMIILYLYYIGGDIKFLIKSVGEEYQIVKRGREYHCCGEEYNMKRGIGNYIIFPLILQLLERISSGEKGNGTEISWKKIKT